MIDHKLSDEALRDFFAGVTLHALVSKRGFKRFWRSSDDRKFVTSCAYEMADEMLKTRGKKDAGQD